MIPNDSRVGKAHGERVHPLVEAAPHEQQRVPAQEVRYRARVARLEEPALVVQDEPVRVRVGREDGRLAEQVGREDRTVSGDPVVDEGLRVLRLVGGDELEGLPDEGEAQVPRGEAAPPRRGGAAEEGEDG